MRSHYWRLWLVGLFVALLSGLVVPPSASAAEGDSLADCAVCEASEFSVDSFGPGSPAAEERAQSARPPTIVGGPDTAIAEGGDGGASFIFPNEVPEGDLDPRDVKILYPGVRTEKPYSWLPDWMPINGVEIPVEIRAPWGPMADFFFTAYKTVVHIVISLIGVVIFGLLLVAVMLDPALALGESFRVAFLEPGALVALVFALAAAGALFHWLAGRYGLALRQIAVPIAILVIGAALVPAEAARWMLSTASSGAGVILLAGSGEDPSVIPEPGSGSVDVSEVYGAYRSFTSKLEEPLIGEVAEVLTFGQQLSPECEAPYERALAEGRVADDNENFRYMVEAGECAEFIAHAWSPQASLALYGLILFIYSLVFAVIFLKLSREPVVGQIGVVACVAFWPFILLFAIAPGPLRARATLLLGRVAAGLVGVFVFAIALVLILLTMTAVFATTAGLPMLAQLILALAVPSVVLMLTEGGNRGVRRAAARVAAAVASPAAKADGGSPARADGGIRRTTDHFVAGAAHEAVRVGRTTAMKAGRTALHATTGAAGVAVTTAVDADVWMSKKLKGGLQAAGGKVKDVATPSEFAKAAAASPDEPLLKMPPRSHMYFERKRKPQTEETPVDAPTVATPPAPRVSPAVSSSAGGRPSRSVRTADTRRREFVDAVSAGQAADRTPAERWVASRSGQPGSPVKSTSGGGGDGGTVPSAQVSAGASAGSRPEPRRVRPESLGRSSGPDGS